MRNTYNSGSVRIYGNMAVRLIALMTTVHWMQIRL